MKRKFVAAVLVLAMIIGVGTIAMAEEPEPGYGEAGIAYEEGKVEVTGPGDPLIPDEEDDDGNKIGPWSFVTDRDLDFGEHDVLTNIDEQRFASWLEHRGDGTDYVGIIIKNGTVIPYQIVVGIEQFYAGKEETLLGFELELVTGSFKAKDDDGNTINITNPHGHIVSNPVKATANSTHLKFDLERDYRGKSIDAGNNGENPVTARIFDIPGLGIHAATWGGVLTVPPSSVAATGEAQAVMTWNIMNVGA